MKKWLFYIIVPIVLIRLGIMKGIKELREAAKEWE
jgi:hypothetical protein